MAQQHEWRVKVRKQGTLLRTFYGIVAPDVESAIEFVEKELGQVAPNVQIDVKTGAMCVFAPKGWQPYEYIARMTA